MGVTKTTGMKRPRRAKKEKAVPVHLQAKSSVLKASKASKKAVDVAWSRSEWVQFFKKRGLQPAASDALLAFVGKRIQKQMSPFTAPGKKRALLPRMSTGGRRALNNVTKVVVQEMASRASTAASVDVAMAKNPEKKKARVSGRLADAACASFVSSVGIPAVHTRVCAGTKKKKQPEKK